MPAELLPRELIIRDYFHKLDGSFGHFSRITPNLQAISSDIWHMRLQKLQAWAVLWSSVCFHQLSISLRIWLHKRQVDTKPRSQRASAFYQLPDTEFYCKELWLSDMDLFSTSESKKKNYCAMTKLSKHPWRTKLLTHKLTKQRTLLPMKTQPSVKPAGFHFCFVTPYQVSNPKQTPPK